MSIERPLLLQATQEEIIRAREIGMGKTAEMAKEYTRRIAAARADRDGDLAWCLEKDSRDTLEYAWAQELRRIIENRPAIS